MWTNEIVPCTGCGSEVALVTDGREAYAYTATAERGYDYGETTRVWREGIVLTLTCPADSENGTCSEELVFPGEGLSCKKEPLVAIHAEPIQETRP